MQQIDWGLYSACHHLRHARKEWLPFLEAGSYFGDWVFLLVVVLLPLGYFLAGSPRKWSAILLAALVLISLGLGEGVRLLVDSRRPGDMEEILGADRSGGSFPSRPVFVTALTLSAGWLFQCRPGASAWRTWGLFAIAALFQLWVMAAQLFLCENFVSDVLAGLLAGSGLGYVSYRITARSL